MFMISADAISRYAFNHPWPGVQEIVSQYLMVIIAFLTMAYVQSKKKHITARVFQSRLSLRALAIHQLLVTTLASAFIGLLAWTAGAKMLSSLETGEYMTGLVRLSMWPPRSILFIGAFTMCIVLVKDIFRAIQLFRGKSSRSSIAADQAPGAEV
jgi:TRAP-type C4-dicarboxylate transport system permease small subunit